MTNWGRIYIYYTLGEIQEDLSGGHDKATKLLVDMDSGKGAVLDRLREERHHLVRPLLNGF